MAILILVFCAFSVFSDATTWLGRFQCNAASFDFVHDFLNRRRPHERSGIFIPGAQELLDRHLQFLTVYGSLRVSP